MNTFLDTETKVNDNISCCCDYLRGSFDCGSLYKTFLDFLTDLNLHIQNNTENSSFRFCLDHFYLSDCRNMFGRYTSFANWGHENIVRFYWFSETPGTFELNVHPDNGCRILFEFTGDGIRRLKQYKIWDSLIKFLYSKNPSMTRLDVALDFFNRDNAFIPLLQDAFNHEFAGQMGFGDACLQSRMNLDKLRPLPHKDIFRSWNRISVNYQCLNPNSELGGFRLYDKWLEIKSVPRFKNIADMLLAHLPDEYWWRLEYETVNDTATLLFNLWNDPTNSHGFLSCVEWCLSNFFSIKEYKSEGYQRCQLDSVLVWVDLLSFFSSVSHSSLNSYLTKQPYVTCIDSTRRRMAAHSTATTRDLFSLFVDDQIFNDVISKQKFFGTDKHLNLVLEYSETKDIPLPDPHELKRRVDDLYQFIVTQMYRRV